MARPSGTNRGRLLLVTLLVSALLLITLDLRGVSVIGGIKNGVGAALAPIEKVGGKVVSPFKNFFSDIFHLARNRSIINSLREQNANLRTELAKRKDADAELGQLKGVLDLAGSARWKVVSARVLNQGSSFTFTQTVTLDQGSRSGIRPNMTVINAYGLVGVVKQVFPNSSVVLLATDPSFKIGARVVGSQTIGILQGQGTSKGVLQLLDNTAEVHEKDVVLSRGSTNDVPFVPGVPIGYISKISHSSNAAGQLADISFYANMNTLDVVSVVVSAQGSNPGDALVPPPPVPTPIPTVTVTVTPTPDVTKVP